MPGAERDDSHAQNLTSAVQLFPLVVRNRDPCADNTTYNVTDDVPPPPLVSALGPPVLCVASASDVPARRRTLR